MRELKDASGVHLNLLAEAASEALEREDNQQIAARYVEQARDVLRAEIVPAKAKPGGRTH